MPYCGQCGKELKKTDSFCGACGAKQSRTQVGTPTPLPPQEPAFVQPVPQPKHSGNTRWGMIIMGVLVAGLITFGVLYGISTNNLSQARADIAELENNVAALQNQLTTEQAHAASLQTQLTAAINDLNSSQAQVTHLQADLNASELRIINLQSELDAASTELEQAYSELSSLTDANASLTEELTMIKDPRHFNSLQELQTWLENDDTNTNSAYSSLTSQSKAYVLQIKALREGYILSACIDWDSNFIYSWNVAVIGDKIYSVNADTDAITAGPSFADALPLHPLPLS